MSEPDEPNLPLQDEAKARPEWRGDDEKARPEGSETEQSRAREGAEGALLKDAAQRPPD
jgi:hypothetical protein